MEPPALPSGWTVRRLDEVTSRIQDGTHFSPKPGGSDYQYITSRNIGAGQLRLDSVERISEAEHRKIFRRCDVRHGDLLLTKDGANTGNAAINSFAEEISLLSSVAFIRCDPRKSTETYLLQYLLSEPGRQQIQEAMAGNAITRLTLAKIKALRVPVPPVAEQRAIAQALGGADAVIATLEQLIAKRQAIKQGFMQQAVVGTIRLPGFSTSWKPQMLDQLLSYEQPGPYLVKTTRQLESGQVPVLTAGKTFVLGYTNESTGVYVGVPVIIFDDFTTASKFVDFPFKAKSSAMKILSARPGVDLRFVYERMQLLNFSLGDHKRYWISEFSKQEMLVPPYEEQVAIASVADSMDRQMRMLERRLSKARDIKQGMMQQLLTGRTRLSSTGEAA